MRSGACIDDGGVTRVYSFFKQTKMFIIENLLFLSLFSLKKLSESIKEKIIYYFFSILKFCLAFFFSVRCTLRSSLKIILNSSKKNRAIQSFSFRKKFENRSNHSHYRLKLFLIKIK